MAGTLAIEPTDVFEFNPAAQEFVPFEAHTVLEDATWPSGFIPPSCGQAWTAQAAYLAGSPWLGPLPTCDVDGPPGLLEAKKNEDKAEAKDKQPSERTINRRRTSSSVPGSPGLVATLVVKNLGVNVTQDYFTQFLKEKGVPPSGVEFHKDATGSFKGTAFVRYLSPDEAKSALDKLGGSPEVAGRKTRVELQKSKGVFGRRSLESELPQEELEVVREEIESFVKDTARTEHKLPSQFNAYQRKYAHSLAERHGLAHVTQETDEDEKCVFLSRSRPPPTPGSRKKTRSVSSSPLCGSAISPDKFGAFDPFEMARLLAPYSSLSPPLVPLPPGLYDAEYGDEILGAAALGPPGL